jgi:hypothetical protein
MPLAFSFGKKSSPPILDSQTRHHHTQPPMHDMGKPHRPSDPRYLQKHAMHLHKRVPHPCPPFLLGDHPEKPNRPVNTPRKVTPIRRVGIDSPAASKIARPNMHRQSQTASCPPLNIVKRVATGGLLTQDRSTTFLQLLNTKIRAELLQRSFPYPPLTRIPCRPTLTLI